MNRCYDLLVMTSLFAAGILATDNDAAVTSTCCWPLQFQSQLGRYLGLPVGGSPGTYEEEMLLSYDLPYKRWGFSLRENFVTNDYMELIYFEDYQTRKASIANFDGCYRLPLPEGARMRLPCLPTNARYVETGYLGDNEKLPYDVWQWEVDQEDFLSGEEHVPATVTVSLSHDNCKPVSEISWWTANAFNYTAYIGFLTMHIGESDGFNEDPYGDLARFYNCTDVDELPKAFDVRWDVHADQIHLINRIHAPSSMPDEKPTF